MCKNVLDYGHTTKFWNHFFESKMMMKVYAKMVKNCHAKFKILCFTKKPEWFKIWTLEDRKVNYTPYENVDSLT